MITIYDALNELESECRNEVNPLSYVILGCGR